MSASVKLIKKGVDKEIARKLVEHGYYTPKVIRELDNDMLKKVTGLSLTKVRSLKKQLGA